MKIGGFQKFSLLDYPGHLAAIVFTRGCNFRCPYCHNPELVDPNRYGELIPEQEVMDFLISRQGKLGAVSITGGEPTLQEDLIGFLRKLRSMKYLIKIDTNGSRPEVLEEISREGLVDYWAMDIKAPPHLYKLVTGYDLDFEQIIASMDILRVSGKDYEFRTTFFDALFNWSDLSLISALLKPGDHFYLQQCRYDNTLDGVQSSGLAKHSKDGSEYFHLVEHPACQNLLEWGGRNRVNVGIRSL